MTQTTESTDYPLDQNLPTEPLRCPVCGDLFYYYSPASNATLSFRCDKCSTDFDITLKEGSINFRKKSKRKQANTKSH